MFFWGLLVVVAGVCGLACCAIGTRNLSKVVCLSVEVDGVSTGVVRCATGVVWVGSHSWSPGSVGMLAVTNMSRRFFGLLYPVISFLRWICEVAELVPRMVQFFWTIFSRVSSFGL